MAEYQQGKYIAVVESQGFDRTTNGKEFFGLIVRPVYYVINDVHGGEKERVTNPFPRTVNIWLTTDKAIAFARVKLKYLFGWEGSSWSELSPDTPGYTDFSGIEIDVINTHSAGTTNPEKMYDNFDIQLPRVANLENDGQIPKRLDRLGGSLPSNSEPPSPAANLPSLATPLPPPAQAVPTAAPKPAEDEVPF